MDQQIGLEATPDEYVARIVAVFREVRRVLAEDGTLWLNLGDSYAQSEVRMRNGSGNIASECKKAVEQTGRRVEHGLKPKDLVGIPWRVAFALQADGWYLRQDIIWAKPNPMPESVTDRCTKSHEYVFMLSKSPRYFYDADAIAEPAVTGKWDAMPPIGGVKHAGSNGNPTYSGNTPPGGGTRNARSVWTIPTQPYPEAHFATFPEELPTRCIKAGSAVGDTVLDPFTGSGTTLAMARLLGRNGVGCELNPSYAAMAEDRIGRTIAPNTYVKKAVDHSPLFGSAV